MRPETDLDHDHGTLGTVTTGLPGSEPVELLAAPDRPSLMGDKDYSDSRSATFCAVEINFAQGRGLCTKIGHYSAIVEAHFPNASEVYRQLARAAEILEAHGNELKKTRGVKNRQIGASLLLEAEWARAALAKAGGA